MVLDLAKPLLGDVEAKLTDRVRDLSQRGHRKFLLNLAEVSWLDSHGLGDLVAASQAACKVDAKLGLCNVHEYVSEPLRIMNVLKEFETFDKGRGPEELQLICPYSPAPHSALTRRRPLGRGYGRGLQSHGHPPRPHGRHQGAA